MIVDSRPVQYSSKPVKWDVAIPKPSEGYVFLGSLFQAYPPAGYTWPEQLVQAIRRDIDPMLCPMFCWYVYSTPEGGTYREGRHWLWIDVGYPDGPYEKRKFIPAMTGPNVGRHPNVQVLECAKKRTPEQENLGIGGDYMPFDWGVYEWLQVAREGYTEDPTEAAMRVVRSQRSSQSAANKWASDELDYATEDNMKYLSSLKTRPSESEVRKYMRYGNERWERKPFVHVRSEVK